MNALIDGAYVNAAGSRNYKLYVATSRPRQPPPLFVMLHGCDQDAADFAVGTRMNELAEEFRGVVLYPEQCRLVNPFGCWSWHDADHQSADHGEPSLIAGMTRQVIAEHKIDPARVHVAGMSAGGAMAVILGQEYPDLYAAVGVHSGVPSGVASDLVSAPHGHEGGTGRDRVFAAARCPRCPRCQESSPRRSHHCFPRRPRHDRSPLQRQSGPHPGSTVASRVGHHGVGSKSIKPDAQSGRA